MTDAYRVLENRLEELSVQVFKLTGRVDELAAAMAVRVTREQAAPNAAYAAAAPAEPAEDSENIGGGQLLAASATVCFILAVALGLRTLVDTGIINQRAGSFIGLAYGIGLIGYGHYRYSRAHRLIPIFSVCGAMLLYAVVLETVMRFGTLSFLTAYLILYFAVIAMTALGMRHRVPSLVAVGVLGATTVGLVLHFPNCPFLYLAALFFLANAAAYSAARKTEWRWLLWCVLALTSLFWLTWTIKVRASLTREVVADQYLAANWFLPTLALFIASYVAMASYAAYRHKRPFGAFEAFLPSFGGAGGYFCASVVMTPWMEQGLWAGTIGLALAAIYTALVALLWRDTQGKAAVVAFTLAAILSAATAMPLLLPMGPPTYVAWATLAVGAAIIAWLRNSAVLYGAAGLLQLFCFGMAVIEIFGLAMEHVSAPIAGAAVVLAAAALGQYLLRPRKSSEAGYVASWSNSSVAIAALVISVAYSYWIARHVLYVTLAALVTPYDNAFSCWQTLIINGGAVVLWLAGLHWRRLEVVTLGIAVAAIGAVKVFAVDIIHCTGAPLVASVVSLGLVALIGSLLVNRWHLQPRVNNPEESATATTPPTAPQ